MNRTRDRLIKNQKAISMKTMGSFEFIMTVIHLNLLSGLDTI